MLISKGVSKIVKKYGYLPVDYLKNEQNTIAELDLSELKQFTQKKTPIKQKRSGSRGHEDAQINTD
jgi:hypothetical protein